MPIPVAERYRQCVYPNIQHLPFGAGSITSTPWNDTRGGIVAAIVDTTASIGGAGINVSGQGFRGGVVHTGQTVFGTIIVSLFRTTNALNGAEKGEGIAGFQTEYDALNGRYGRGAPANGGGGGNEHNAGGGGVANGNNAFAYNDLGNPSLAVRAVPWRFGRALGIWKAVHFQRILPVAVAAVVTHFPIAIKMRVRSHQVQMPGVVITETTSEALAEDRLPMQ